MKFFLASLLVLGTTSASASDKSGKEVVQKSSIRDSARGFRLAQIRPGSFYDKLGLKSGDTVLRVGSEAIVESVQALKALGNLKNAKEATDIEVERTGRIIVIQAGLVPRDSSPQE